MTANLPGAPGFIQHAQTPPVENRCIRVCICMEPWVFNAMWGQSTHAGMSGNCEREIMPTPLTAICSLRRGIVRMLSEPSGLKRMALTISSFVSSSTPSVPFTNSVAMSWEEETWAKAQWRIEVHRCWGSS